VTRNQGGLTLLFLQPRVNLKIAPYFVMHQFCISSPPVANLEPLIAYMNSKFANFIIDGWQIKSFSVFSRGKTWDNKGVNPPSPVTSLSTKMNLSPRLAPWKNAKFFQFPHIMKLQILN